ncbi:hypothetical protein [Parendozoicomonas haliclonae]|uniref:Uncharacterized protein n=1 Tax=Parendozoicomonas haliclonae TaxID=1960125 RepID=A0A1X7AEJ8_9GAMM|nr:hypothetical protein [Parendozoicomonas haliclonae]SMA33413.1 hypothetical protein EHSB41UT_00275 [Parendozoicomonas haliclonae]
MGKEEYRGTGFQIEDRNGEQLGALPATGEGIFDLDRALSAAGQKNRYLTVEKQLSRMESDIQELALQKVHAAFADWRSEGSNRRLPYKLAMERFRFDEKLELTIRMYSLMYT